MINLFKALNTEESLAEQIIYIIDQGCPNLDDPEGCATGVTTWWRRMASALYLNYNFVSEACKSLDPRCEVPSYAQ